MRLDAHPYEKSVAVAFAEGPQTIKLPRSRTIALVISSTNSLTFTLQANFVTGDDFKNVLCYSQQTGLRYFAGETITAVAGDVLILQGAGVRDIRITPAAGSGVIVVRASEYGIEMVQESCKVYSFIADATDELLIKSTPGVVYGVQGYTIDATPVYLKMYNKATAPNETDTPVYRVGVPANSTAALGSGNNGMFPRPVYHSTGIGVRAVVGLADADDTALTATENLINVFYN